MIQNIFQQRYLTSNGWIVIHQEGLEPMAGEAVLLADGQPAPDGRYEVNSSEWKQVIEVREGMVHHYRKRPVEKSISAGKSFLMLLLFLILLFLLFKLLGR